MGVPYSHLTQEEMERNLKFNEGRAAKKVEVKGLGRKAKNWCSCNLGQEAHSLHVPPNKECSICKEVRQDDGKMDVNHYHCGACLKLWQIE